MEVSLINSNNQLTLNSEYDIDYELYKNLMIGRNINFDNILLDEDANIEYEFEFDEEIRLALEKNNLFMNNY